MPGAESRSCAGDGKMKSPGARTSQMGDVVTVSIVADVEGAIRISKRNTRDSKARRRAERERRQHPIASGQVPQAAEVRTFEATKPAIAFTRRGPDKRGSSPRADGEGDSTQLALEQVDDLDTAVTLEDAAPDDFGDLDADDADLQATLTVLAVLADDIDDGAAGDTDAELDLDPDGDADGLEALDGSEVLEDAEPSLFTEPDDEAEVPGATSARVAEPPPQVAVEDEESLVLSDDDDDLPAAHVGITGATADPVKDYLKQI
ncbi:MAG: hypothetical protein ACRDNS_27265, partial [Trebonia sp.]